MEGSKGWKQYLPYMYMYRMLSIAKTIQHYLLVAQFFYRTLCMEYGTFSIGMQQVTYTADFGTKNLFGRP